MTDSPIGRRDFVKQTAAVTIGVGLAGATSGSRGADRPFDPLPKGVQLRMLPQDLTDSDKFKLAKSCGFDGIEANPIDDLAAARKQADLARKAGVPIHSIVFGGWHAPLSDPDPVVVEEGLRGMERALRSAEAMGADTVLLVPAVVTERVRYGDAYARSQQHIRKLLPLAEKLGVIIAVENVWNKFLLSPIEFARYVDEFESPWLRAYFDVGNVVAFGYPEDWIRTLGKRIVKVHLKDFKRGPHKWAPLREGDVDWPEVRRALAEVGYTGFLTCELKGGNEKYLRDVSARMSRIAAGE